MIRKPFAFYAQIPRVKRGISVERKISVERNGIAFSVSCTMFCINGITVK